MNNDVSKIIKRSIFEGIKSIKKGKPDEAIIHLSLAMSFSGDVNEEEINELLSGIGSGSLSREIKRNLKKEVSVPLFISKEIEEVGSLNDFLQNIRRTKDERLFTNLFIANLENNPQKTKDNFLNLSKISKEFFSDEFNIWSLIKESKK